MKIILAHPVYTGPDAMNSWNTFPCDPIKMFSVRGVEEFCLLRQLSSKL